LGKKEMQRGKRKPLPRIHALGVANDVSHRNAPHRTVSLWLHRGRCLPIDGCWLRLSYLTGDAARATSETGATSLTLMTALEMPRLDICTYLYRSKFCHVLWGFHDAGVVGHGRRVWHTCLRHPLKNAPMVAKASRSRASEKAVQLRLM
jgi:hypothetical protein